MTLTQARTKIIECHEAGKTICVIMLLLQFGRELLLLFIEYKKEKNAKENQSENKSESK